MSLFFGVFMLGLVLVLSLIHGVLARPIPLRPSSEVSIESSVMGLIVSDASDARISHLIPAPPTFLSPHWPRAAIPTSETQTLSPGDGIPIPSASYPVPMFYSPMSPLLYSSLVLLLGYLLYCFRRWHERRREGSVLLDSDEVELPSTSSLPPPWRRLKETFTFGQDIPISSIPRSRRMTSDTSLAVAGVRSGRSRSMSRSPRRRGGGSIPAPLRRSFHANDRIIRSTPNTPFSSEVGALVDLSSPHENERKRKSPQRKTDGLGCEPFLSDLSGSSTSDNGSIDIVVPTEVSSSRTPSAIGSPPIITIRAVLDDKPKLIDFAPTDHSVSLGLPFDNNTTTWVTPSATTDMLIDLSGNEGPSGCSVVSPHGPPLSQPTIPEDNTLPVYDPWSDEFDLEAGWPVEAPSPVVKPSVSDVSRENEPYAKPGPEMTLAMSEQQRSATVHTRIERSDEQASVNNLRGAGQPDAEPVEDQTRLTEEVELLPMREPVLGVTVLVGNAAEQHSVHTLEARSENVSLPIIVEVHSEEHDTSVTRDVIVAADFSVSDAPEIPDSEPETDGSDRLTPLPTDVSSARNSLVHQEDQPIRLEDDSFRNINTTTTSSGDSPKPIEEDIDSPLPVDRPSLLGGSHISASSHEDDDSDDESNAQCSAVMDSSNAHNEPFNDFLRPQDVTGSPDICLPSSTDVSTPISPNEELPEMPLHPDPELPPLPTSEQAFRVTSTHPAIAIQTLSGSENNLPPPLKRPAWSVRAADAPSLGIISSQDTVPSPGKSSHLSLPIPKETFHAVTSAPNSPVKSSTALPGSFPADAATADAEKKSTSVQVSQSAARRRIARSPIDIALAMQLRPGLGLGADPAWMVRFLMSMFGWFIVVLSGTGSYEHYSPIQ